MVGRLLPAVLPILLQGQPIAQASKAPLHWRVVAGNPVLRIPQLE